MINGFRLYIIRFDSNRIESNQTKKALELVPVPVIMIFVVVVVLLFESGTLDLLDRYCHYLYSIHFYLHIYNDDCNI